MIKTQQMLRGLRRGAARPVFVALGAAVVLLGACGGGNDGPTTPGMSPLRSEKEQAALTRAHTLNADAMSKIQRERAAGQR